MYLPPAQFLSFTQLPPPRGHPYFCLPAPCFIPVIRQMNCRWLIAGPCPTFPSSCPLLSLWVSLLPLFHVTSFAAISRHAWSTLFRINLSLLLFFFPCSRLDLFLLMNHSPFMLAVPLEPCSFFFVFFFSFFFFVFFFFCLFFFFFFLLFFFFFF